ncbi:MAG: helix-turn-helix domain-containing protein [Chthoniobacterales bacterium]|nr:helix-turn-helix domain-containing protein [Chthoniobacterales bacterium]
MAISWPSLARQSAMPRPSPRLAPVTRMTGRVMAPLCRQKCGDSMGESAFSSTNTTLFIVLMPKIPRNPVSPIVLRRLRLRCGNWFVRSLRVNRHLQPFDRFAPHRHAHGQLLLYLRGHGEQRVGPKKYPVGPGSVFFVPRGRMHEFREQAPRRAICLVADLGGAAPKNSRFRCGRLSADALMAVRQHVASLSGERGRDLDLIAGAAMLFILDACRRACTGEPAPERPGATILARLRRGWHADNQGNWPRPGELARRTGLQKDYLNRLVRQASGLTLGQWRDRELLRMAENELRRGNRVTAVADELGFRDPSYFARWFRKQTGLPPSHWQPVWLRSSSSVSRAS